MLRHLSATAGHRFPNWRFHSLALLFCLFSLLISACGGQSANTNASNTDTGDRVIKHAMGETKVPAHPKRVVVLDTGELDNAIALGITPVGAVSAFPDGKLLTYWGDKTKAITLVGTIAQPNLEKIMSLSPDLILSSKVRHEKIYKELSEIAPTVFTETVGAPWKENFKLQAEALNKIDEYNRLMNAYNQRLTEFKQKMGAKLSSTHVSMVRVLSDRVRIYQNKSFVGTLLKDAGLPRPAAQDKDDFFIEDSSYERIKDMDGDVIFLMNYGNSEDRLEELTHQAQWKQLQAVKSGRVYRVSDDIWALGLGIGAADKVIDDLFTYLAK
uniref:Iron siderophore-binding protein n=1 Tax=Thermosporothrix sp. COM3 TaxID=2490863 RepID=A0A455SWG0_9CHLR|nr:iron siderophore-binding protein [Thermosporothrix sp. COM3]